MSTLTDSFWDDLEELDEEEEEGEEGGEGKEDALGAAGGALLSAAGTGAGTSVDARAGAGAGAGVGAGAGAASGAGDAFSDSDDEMAGGEAGTGIGLDAVLGGLASGSGVQAVTNLRRSARFKDHMRAIDEVLEAGKPMQVAIGGSLEDDPQYQLIVTSNELVTELDVDLAAVHQFVVDKYAPKFSELESMVKNPLDYFRVVKIIGNETDMTSDSVDLSAVLSSALVMMVTVTGSTSNEKPLPEDTLRQVLEGCDEGLALNDARVKMLEFVESRMNVIAPNVSAIIGTAVAAQLVGLAGGLAALTKIPGCNLQVIGQQKKVLAGFSSRNTMSHKGILFESPVVQSAPPGLRVKALRVTANKVALAVRSDFARSASDGSVGLKFRQMIEKKIEKWQEPPPAKMKKALKAPDDRPSKRRGGKRHRAQKAKWAMSEMRKESMRLAFGKEDGEYGDSTMGLTTGLLGAKSGSGRIRAPTKKKEKKQAARRQKRSTGSGLSSSLAFTPIQGLELPAEQLLRTVQASQDKYFSNTAMFTKKAAKRARTTE